MTVQPFHERAESAEYHVAPDVAAVIIEAARCLGAPIRHDARSPEAFERALARLLRLAHCEINLRLYESANRYKP